MHGPKDTISELIRSKKLLGQKLEFSGKTLGMIPGVSLLGPAAPGEKPDTDNDGADEERRNPYGCDGNGQKSKRRRSRKRPADNRSWAVGVALAQI